MKFMLDTNICIFIIKQKSSSVLGQLKKHKVGDIGISSITLAELRYGASKSLYPERNHQALNEFILPLDIADFDEEAALAYGEIRSNLEKKGTPVGSLDTLIGAHAASLGVTLVTNNIKEFRRIKELAVVDWTL
jgi:tRNA(fMet)-specific endonuclease VapC